MADGELADAVGPGRRRESWSLRTIVENVAGRPIAEFQDPARPVHPYLGAQLARLPRADAARAGARRAATAGRSASDEPDPIDRVYPPLTGATGRALHGPEHEHHAATLRGIDDGDVGRPAHAPGPSRRPERIYLHYLLLHMDRLSVHALRYLRRAVDEELTARRAPPEPAEPAPASG